MRKIYGLYSAKQQKIGGLVSYYDKHGNIKYVTEVTSDPDYIGHWDDVVKIGELTSFITRLENGTTPKDNTFSELEAEIKLRAITPPNSDLLSMAQESGPPSWFVNDKTEPPTHEWRAADKREKQYKEKEKEQYGSKKCHSCLLT